MREIKRESLSNRTVAQGEDVKPVERVEHAVEALEKWITGGELKIGEMSPRAGRVMNWGFCTRRELYPWKQVVSQHEKPRALGSTLSETEDREEQQSRRTQEEQLI